MLAVGVAYTCCLIFTGKSPLESDQVNEETTLGNHHTRLFVRRIPPLTTASLMMYCAQAHRHVETILSGAENKQMCILSVLLLASMTIKRLFVLNR
ncbi:hypothetical protein AVEN_272438-1 [Araneus ventricosus]|uniref:Uncharacterized protein n=1 Tax=Araneus ventricosus TaxID=182803 RepID=A0A4Y2LNZ3_ARAVE|nr:hypothetical protein AVEN_272438-1 [Araneus ventricosus]